MNPPTPEERKGYVKVSHEMLEMIRDASDISGHGEYILFNTIADWIVYCFDDDVSLDERVKIFNHRLSKFLNAVVVCVKTEAKEVTVDYPIEDYPEEGTNEKSENER